MSSRSDDIKEMANLMGNAAMHRAIYGDAAFTIREAALYEGQAQKIADMRNWNDQELAQTAQRAKRDTRNLMKQRQDDWHGKSYDELCFLADREIDKFIMRTKERKTKRKRK